jgi:hypothetical protein
MTDLEMGRQGNQAEPDVFVRREGWQGGAVGRMDRPGTSEGEAKTGREVNRNGFGSTALAESRCDEDKVGSTQRMGGQQTKPTKTEVAQ